MHRPYANTHCNTATGQPDASCDPLTPRDTRGHIQRGIGSKDGNNKGEDYKDMVVLANQHDRFNSSVRLRRSDWEGRDIIIVR